jgi:hypothetical protein
MNDRSIFADLLAGALLWKLKRSDKPDWEELVALRVSTSFVEEFCILQHAVSKKQSRIVSLFSINGSLSMGSILSLDHESH